MSTVKCSGLKEHMLLAHKPLARHGLTNVPPNQQSINMTMEMEFYVQETLHQWQSEMITTANVYYKECSFILSSSTHFHNPPSDYS